MISLKEVYKELSLAKKHFHQAVELARKNLIVGELKFEGEKPKRIRPSSPKKKPAPSSKKELTDKDRGDKFYDKRESTES